MYGSKEPPRYHGKFVNRLYVSTVDAIADIPGWIEASLVKWPLSSARFDSRDSFYQSGLGQRVKAVVDASELPDKQKQGILADAYLVMQNLLKEHIQA